MAKVSSSFIRPIHGISQQTPHIRPDGFVEDMLNMFADVNRGLRRRPGSEFLTKFTGVSNKIYKFFEHDDKLKLFVYDKSTGDVSVYTEGDWSNPLTTTASGDIKDYLDTLEDDEDLLLSIYQNNLYIASKQKPLQFTATNHSVTFDVPYESIGEPRVIQIQVAFIGDELETYQLHASGHDQFYYDNINSTYDLAQEYIDSIPTALNPYIASTTHNDTAQFTITFHDDVIFNIASYTTYRMPLSITNYQDIDDSTLPNNSAYLTLTFTYVGSSYPLKYVHVNYDVIDIATETVTTIDGTIELNSANTINMNKSTDLTTNWTLTIPETNGSPDTTKIRLVPNKTITKINFVSLDAYVGGWTVSVVYHDPANPSRTSVLAAGDTFNLNLIPMKVVTIDVFNAAFMPKIRFDYQYFNDAISTYTNDPGGTYEDAAESIAYAVRNFINTVIATQPFGYTTAAATYNWIQVSVSTGSSVSLTIYYWAGYHIIFEALPVYAPEITISSSGSRTILDTTTAPLRLHLSSSLTLTQLDIHLTDQTADLVFLYSYIQGQPIIDITVYQNRLILITKSAMLASQIGRFNNFDPEQPDVYSDADPIVLLIASKGDELQAMLPFNDSIVFFGKEQQYTLFVNGIFSLTNLTLLPATSYTISSTKPIRVGSEAYFVTPNNNYSILKKYIVQPNTQIKTAYDITTFVPKFILVNPKTLAYSEPIDLLVVHPAANSNELYVCNQHFSGMQQDQQAWHKWTFAYNIQQVFIDSDGVIYMIHSNGSEYYVVKLNPVNNDTPYYMDYIVAANPPEWVSNLPAGTVVAYVAQSGGDWIDVETEAEADYKGFVYNSYVTFSPWYLKDNKGNPMTAGKLQLKSLEMVFDNTWYFKVTSQSYGRPPVFKDFKNVQLDGVLILGGVEEEGLDSSDTTSGIFKMYIGGQAPNTFIKVSNEGSVWNFGVIGYTLYGNWQGYNQWTTIKR